MSEIGELTRERFMAMAEAAGLGELVRAASLTPPDSAGAIDGRPTAKADQFAWFALGALTLLVWSAAVEIPARPRLRRRRVQALAHFHNALVAFAVAPA